MNPIPVLSLVVRSEVRNRFRQQMKRLRQPKYLIATIVGLTYLWFVALRRLFFFAPGTSRAIRPGAGSWTGPWIVSAIEAGVLFFGFIQVMFIWLFPTDRSQFGFNEGEVQFLFPAPVTRRWLVNYKLLKRLIGIVLGTFVTLAFVFRGLSAVGSNPWPFAIGTGLALIILYLHRIAAAFTKERLRQLRRWGQPGLWCFLTGMFALIAFALWRSWLEATTAVPNLRNFPLALKIFVGVHPLDWLLFPFQLIVQVMFAKDAKQFLIWLPPALALAAGHYVWLLLVLVPFEESALQASELRSRMSRDPRRREVQPSKVLALRLSSAGRPEIGIIWKNWLAAIRKVGARTIILLFAIGMAAFSVAAAMRKATVRGAGASGGLAMVAVMLLAFLVLLGPTMVRIDLRHDLKRLDVLRSLPLTGFQIVSAEVLASGLLLLSLEFIAAAIAFLFWPQRIAERFPVAVGIVALLPGISFLGMLIQNAAALLFPNWVGTGETRVRGLEATGQRLLTVGGTLFVLIIGILPGAVVSAIVLLLFWTSLKFWAIAIAGALAGGMLLAESYVGLLGLGRLFDAHDVSD